MPDGSEKDTIIGQDVEGNRLLQELGRSNLGVVYRAEDLTLGRTVALRKLAPAFIRDEEGVRRLWMWAQGLARLHSPHIVQVYKLCRSELGAFVVSEYVEGGTLYERLLEGPKPWRQVFLLAKQMLHALQAAHRSGIIHGDVRPANIMQISEGSVRMRDFGLALLYDSIATEGDPIGDLAALYYQPPELLSGGTRPDRRSDLYALGVVIYEMLTGDLPYGRPENVYDILRATAEASPRPLGAYVDDLPEELVQMVMRALEKDPARRFRTAAGMLEAMSGATPLRTVAGIVAVAAPEASPRPKPRGLRGLIGRLFDHDEKVAAFREQRDEDEGLEALASSIESIKPVDSASNADLDSEEGEGDSAGPRAQITLFHPTALEPGKWSDLAVYLHFGGDEEVVHRDRREALESPGGHVLGPSGSQGAEAGVVLTVVPRLPGCRFEPPGAQVAWGGSGWCRVGFRALADPQAPDYEPGTDVSGRFAFFVGPVLVAEAAFWVFQEPDALGRERAETHVKTAPYGAVCVAFAREDADFRDQFDRAREALEEGPLRSIRVSETFDEGADVFQLCWSEAAAGSAEVEREWRRALEQKGAEFIRLVSWQHPTPPPPELEGIPLLKLSGA